MIEKCAGSTSHGFFKEHSSPGLIVVSRELDIGAAIEDLLLILAATEASKWVGHLGFVPL